MASGADVIDVGAESARTNRAAITVDEETRRFIGFLDHWKEAWQGLEPLDEEQIWPPVLSANTWRPEVVERILRVGKVEWLNDMGALPNPENAHLTPRLGDGLAKIQGSIAGERIIIHIHDPHHQWPPRELDDSLRKS